MSPHNPAALPEGAVFQERYRIVRCISAGGMGAVYECVHLSTRKRRALKVMLPQIVASPAMRDRFELEARITAAIESDHIVETFDAGIDRDTGAPFLVMELLRGEDLDEVALRHGPLGAEETVVLLAQVAMALDKTHAAGIVHRDLKPQNLFLTTRDDGSARVKILDFGIAKVVADGTKTAQQTASIGTPIYMSPEQTTGDGSIGPAADLYALAHIAFTLLVGHPYWSEEHTALPVYAFLSQMIAGTKEPPTVRAARAGIALPGGFDAWFAKATARGPSYRFERATTQIAELATALGTPPPPRLLGGASTLAERLAEPGRRSVVPSGSEGSGPRPHVGSGSLPGSAPSALASSLGAVQSTARPGAAPARPRRAVIGIAAVLTCALVTLLAVRLMALPGAAPVVASPVAPVVPPPVALTTGVAPVEAPAPQPSVVVAPSAAPASPTTAPRPKAAPAAPAAPPAGGKSCDPPFVVDSTGRRHMKPECL